LVTPPGEKGKAWGMEGGWGVGPHLSVLWSEAGLLLCCR
jgi:hypothetical protein